MIWNKFSRSIKIENGAKTIKKNIRPVSQQIAI
jgi:hypothetical protein